MPTGLQEPKKEVFEISLATDLQLSFSPLNGILEKHTVLGLFDTGHAYLPPKYKHVLCQTHLICTQSISKRYSYI